MILGLGQQVAITSSQRNAVHIANADSSPAQLRLEQGIAAYRSGQLLDAIGHWQQAVELFESPQQQAGVIANLAVAYYETGQYLNALETNKAALDIFLELGQTAAVGRVQSNLGNVYEALGNYDQAIEMYEASRDIAYTLGNQRAAGISIANLGYIYSVQGDQEIALKLYQESLAIATSMDDHEGEAHRLLNMGIAYHALNNISQAADLYEQSFAIAEANGYIALEANALRSLGMVAEERNNYDQAIAYYKQSLAFAESLHHPELIAQILNNLGHTLLAANQLDAAEHHLRTAIQQLDNLRTDLSDIQEVSVFDTQVYSYNLLTQILIAQDNVEDALEIAELGRARAFVKLIASRSNQSQLEVANQAPSIDQIRQIAKDQQATLVEYKLIPDEEFKVLGKQRGTAESLYIWVVSPTGEVAFRQVDLKSLLQERNLSIAQLVEISRDLSGIRGGQNEADSSSRGGSGFATEINRPRYWRTLHQLLIEPIADLLPEDPEARVVFIPQEQLFLVPFPALQAADGSYLIEHHTLLSAPAIQILGLSDRTAPSSGSPSAPPLVVGNPSPMPDDLWPLPHAGDEALGIAQLLSTQPLIGDTATETAVKQQLSTASLIHLATHGFFNEANPLEGALAFAPAPGQDGFLTAAEILSQSLQAQLVVLSACDTGRGQITGDGVIGLSRSFLAAGADNVVVSLWQVPDDATAQLMMEFYRQRQQLDNAQALRQAMLTIHRQYEDPVAWAAFTLIGAMPS